MKKLTALLAAALLIACAPKGEEAAAPAPVADEAEQPAEESPAGDSENPVILPVAGTGETCGGIAAIKCASPADYCALAAGACVSVADAAGDCVTKPEMCTMDYTPVCGCDGKTYPNACAAAAEGVNVASNGECAQAE